MRARKKWIFLSLLSPVLFLASGCLYSIKLENSSPLQIDQGEAQPIALLPITDAPGQPELGSTLQSFITQSLAAKGYRFVDPDVVSSFLGGVSTENFLSDPLLISPIQESLGAKLFMVGNVLSYRIEKSRLGMGTFEVWGGVGYDYAALPTYSWGTFQIELRLQLVKPEDGAVVWVAKGTAQGPSDSAKALTRRLVKRLVEGLPDAAPPP